MKKLALVLTVLAFSVGMIFVPGIYAQSTGVAKAIAIAQTCAKFDYNDGLCKDQPAATTERDPSMVIAIAQTCAKFDYNDGLCKDQPAAMTAQDETMEVAWAQICTQFDYNEGLCK